MGNGVREKVNPSNFLIQVQNGSQSSGDNSQCQQYLWPRNCQWTVVVLEVLGRIREIWRWDSQWLAVRSWQRPSERIIKDYPFKTIWEVAKELKVNHSMTTWHLKQIGNVKKLDKWVPHELTANQKNHHFEVWSSLILCNNKEPFFQLDWSVTQSGLYTTTGDNQLSGWMEKKLQSTSQSQIAPNKVMVTVWWSAASLIRCNFLNLGIIISEKYVQQTDEMHWKV